jgi:hypothetical protein
MCGIAGIIDLNGMGIESSELEGLSQSWRIAVPMGTVFILTGT